jgi:uncharacterized OsmC-like protein
MEHSSINGLSSDSLRAHPVGVGEQAGVEVAQPHRPSPEQASPQVIRLAVQTTLDEAGQAVVRFPNGTSWRMAGDGSAPSPVEAVLAALGACQALTYKYWGERLGVDVQGAEITTRASLDPRGFGGDPSAPQVAPYDLVVEVSLATGADPARVEELASVVDSHCPVHSSLVEPASIARSLAVAPRAS